MLIAAKKMSHYVAISNLYAFIAFSAFFNFQNLAKISYIMKNSKLKYFLDRL